MSQWTLFSNHGHVLLFIAQQPEARLRDIAEQVGITERAVQKIIKDLQDDGFIAVRKQGRRNRYRVQTRKALRHKLESHCSVGELVRLVHGDVPTPRLSGSGVSGAGTGPVSEESASPTSAQATEAPPPAVPKVPVAAPAPEPEPEPEPEVRAEEPPEPEPAADPEPAPEPGVTEDAKPKATKKAGKKKVDDSQGSLF